MHSCTAQLHLRKVTHGKEPAAVSSVRGVAVADGATAHDKIALNTNAAATTTFRIGDTVGDQHVGKSKGAAGKHACAAVFPFRAAPRDAASDHGEMPVPEGEAACIPGCPCVHGVASLNVAIDEPVLCETNEKEDAADSIAGAAVDDHNLRHQH